jgi:hypothetical protein
MENQTESQWLKNLNTMVDGGTSPYVPTSFILSEKQIKEITEWQEKQIQKENPYMGTIGGRFIFQFFTNNIGEVLTVTDIVTDENEDFTDYDLW